MPIEIRMPALSPTMTEGNLARWLKKEGDPVHSGDVIAEIETDKATMEYEAADEGRLGKIIVPEGTQGIKVNQPIALLLEEGEDAAALEKFAARGQAVTSPPTPPPGPLPACGEWEGPAKREGEGQLPAARRSDAEGRVFASPLARRMAVHAGLDLAAIRGSGPQGRIVKADIERTLGQPGAAAISGVAPPQPAAPSVAKSPVPALAESPPYSEKPHSAMRRVIARRMTEAKQTVPHYYMSVDCVIDELLRVRSVLNAGREAHISVNDFVIRAAALA
jgi:pyruvate dehydrogenase E2 component (dihydrolipoamide acetyltransferase)